MAKQTIRQRKALALAQPKKASRSPASKPPASLPPDRISVLWDFDGWPLAVRVHARDRMAAKNYYPEQEGQAEALREGAKHRSQSILSIFHSFLAKWWKR